MGKRYRQTARVGSDEDNEEQNFERSGARKFAEGGSEDKALPVLSEDGRFRRSKVEDDGTKFVRKSKKRSQDDERAVVAPKKREERGKDRKQRKQGENREESARESLPISDDELRIQIASIATAIITSPTKNLARLSELRKVRRDEKQNIQCRVLALASEAQVYVDIAPGFSIKPISEAEKAVKISKEAKQVREYEQSLKAQYEKFVDDVCALSTSRDALIAVTSAKVLASLLTSLPHFNQAERISNSVVANLENRIQSTREVSVQALCSLLAEVHRAPEAVLDICANCTEAIANLAERRRHKLSDSTVSPLTKVRLADLIRAAEVAELKEERVPRGKKGKGKATGEKDLERDMMMAHAETSSLARRKAADRIMSSMCLTFVRVLHGAPSTPNALPSVLAGINNVSVHLASEVVSALVDAISPLISGEKLPLVATFDAIASFFNLIQRQQQVSGFDPVEPTRLEKLLDLSLRRLCAVSFKITEDLMKVIVRAVEVALKQKRGEQVIWASISRRLMNASLASSLHSCSLALLSLAQKAHPNALLASEVISSIAGKCWNPEETNISSAGEVGDTAWELVGLGAHFHPHVGELGRTFARTSSARSDPLQLLQSHRASSGGFNPMIQRSIRLRSKEKPKRKASAIWTDELERDLPIHNLFLQFYFNSRLDAARRAFDQAWYVRLQYKTFRVRHSHTLRGLVCNGFP